MLQIIAVPRVQRMTVETKGRTTGALILGNFPHAGVCFKCVDSQKPKDAPGKPE